MLISRTGICSRKGFTLLELIVVILILSIILAASLPALTGFGEGRVVSDAKHLASVLRYLSDTALSTRSDLTLTLDLRTKLIIYTTPEGKRDEKIQNLNSVVLQSRGAVSEGEVIIPFGPLGASESFRILLGDDKTAAAVEFNSLSGRVRVVRQEDLI